ncbi:MAG: hypothetical protein WCF19_02920 [Chlamydiales bacterium]
MKMKIAKKIKPFSHIPGASCVIPGSCSVIEAFPTLLKIGGRPWKMALTGPVEGFTVQQDLETDCVWVFGRAKEGYFRLKIRAGESGFHIDVEKGPLESAHIPSPIDFISKPSVERLSLGSHKAQDDLRRSDLKTALPILFCLGQKTPWIPPQPLTGTARLLEFPADRKLLYPAIENFIHAAFKGMLVPRLIDDQYQGLTLDEPPQGHPCFLLQEGAKRIRSLFFQQDERRIALLPHLPIPFDCGRLLGIQAPGIGEIDLEWSKKTVRRAIFRVASSGEVILDIPKGIETFRVDKKKKIKRGEPLFLESGKTYHLDRFET